jgi:hypothetical protein
MRVAMHVAAAVSCLLLSSSTVVPVASLDVNKNHELRQEFVYAMGQAVGGKRQRTNLRQENQQEQPADLTKRLLQVARPVEGTPTTTAMSSATFQDRELAENQNNNDQQQYAVNLTAYALKYIGCQNIHTFSDEMAEDQDSTTVLAMNRFVMFRLCPRDSCSNYNTLGCSSGYGDYMISMEEYLAAMVDFFYVEYQEFCETCYYCMKTAANANTNYNSNNGNNNDDANGTDDFRRELNNNGYYNSGYYQFQADDGDAGDDAAAATDDANNAGDGSGQCEYRDVCERYKSACKNYNSKADQFEEYFQCNAFNMGNMVGYMGPHCMSDGVTISIGLYADKNCNQYQSDLADMSAYTGLDFAHSYLQTFYSESCMSCMASVSAIVVERCLFFAFL